MKMHDNRNNNMESFYEENGQYVATTTQSQPTNSIKRPLTLDLNAATNNNKHVDKKQRLSQVGGTPAVFNTPDVDKFKMATPDIEFIISDAGTLQTPTPSLLFANNPARVRIIDESLECFQRRY